MRHRIPTTLVGFLAVALASSCADRGSPAARGMPASSTPVGLELNEGTWPERTETLVQRMALPAALEGGWGVIDHPAARSEPAPDGGHLLALGPNTSTFFITVPVDLEAREFDLVRLKIQTIGFFRAAALVGRGTNQYTIGDFTERFALAEPTTVDLDISELVADTRRLTHFHLAFEVTTHDTTIHGIDLVRRSHAARLPSPLEAPHDVAVGSRSRRGVGLLPGVALTSLLPPVAGGRFTLKATLPPYEPVAPDRELTIELRDGATGLQTARFPLTAGWTTVEVPLDAAAFDAAERGALMARVTTTSPVGAVVGSGRILAGPRPPDAPPPRTVLFITSDTHRSDHMGYAPNGAGVKTPRLDALAANGVAFTDATSVTSVTNPSHAAMFTGLSVRDTGITGNLVLLAERADTLAERFEAGGFRTFAAVSARHLLPWRSGFGQGFERFDAPEVEMTRDGAATIERLRPMLEDAKDHDVFVWLHVFDAHAPYLPHAGCTELYYTGDPYNERLAELAPEVKASWDQRIRDGQYILALYKGETSYVDQLVGGLLDQEPRFARGHVLFTADHGESLGEQGAYWDHSTLFPSTLQVPLFVAGPGIEAGRVVSESVSNINVGRTLLEVAGVPAKGFPGISLLDDKARREAAAEPRYVVGANALSAGVYSEHWYLVMHLVPHPFGPDPQGRLHRVRLYDRRNDPYCHVEVTAAQPEVTARLRKALVTWLAEVPEGGYLTGVAPGSEGAREDVAALGYASNEASSIKGALIDPKCDCPECRLFR